MYTTAKIAFAGLQLAAGTMNGMETVWNVFDGAGWNWVENVQNKAYPEEIFENIGDSWDRATGRQKISLRQLLIRGFFAKNGEVRDMNLQTLLSRVETTHKYNLPAEATDDLYKYLDVQVSKYNEQDVKNRVITIMYLLKPRELHQHVHNNSFVNRVPNPTDRENIINSCIKQLIEKRDVDGTNQLLGSIEKNKETTLGNTTRKAALEFLQEIFVQSELSLQYLRNIPNNDNNNNMLDDESF